MAVEALSEYSHDAVASVEQLRELYGAPNQGVLDKVADRIDELTARYVAATSLVLVGSLSADGMLDVTPRGGPPGFVHVLGPRLLAIGDAAGNRRLDTLQNVLSTGRVGTLFLVPGRADAVRINGRALVTMRPDLLSRLETEGKAPSAALLIEPEEVFIHCPRALRFAHAWEPERWLAAEAAPAMGALWKEHLAAPSPVRR